MVAAVGQAAGREMVEYPEARRHVDRMFRRYTGREPEECLRGMSASLAAILAVAGMEMD